jgi:hypothetical protein
MKTGNKLLENVGEKKLSYLATTTIQNCMQEEIKNIINSRNGLYLSVQNPLSS